jgi:hypothetical protein
MRKRDFLTAAGGIAAALPFRAFAQQTSTLPLIGFSAFNPRPTKGEYFATRYSALIVQR